MKQHLLCLLAMVLLLTGCLEIGGEEEEQPEPEKSYYLQRKLSTITSENGFRHVMEFKYTYNSQQQLTSITTIDTSAFNIVLSYDAENRLMQELLKQGDTRWSFDHVYNAQQQLVKQRETFVYVDGVVRNGYYSHSYNSAGELEESAYYSETGTADRLWHTTKYTYENGQLVKVYRTYADSDEFMEATITYDDKNAPLPLLPLLTVPAYGGLTSPLQSLAKHNIKSLTVQGNGGILYTAASFTATYTYNSAGYPVEATRKYADGTNEVSLYSY